jgi:hypothetical protein
MLLDEIQNEAVEASSDLGTLLRKCKVLAAQLGSQPIEQWILWEANGYPEDAELPLYRQLPVQILGSFIGPFRKAERLPIPPALLPSNIRDQLVTIPTRYSITQVQYLSDDSGSGTLTIPMRDLPLRLNNIYADMQCYSAWGEIPVAGMIGIVNSVRNRILDFVLALRKELPDMGANVTEKQISSIPSDRATTIFLNVTGGYANVVGTAVHSPVNFSITANDLTALRTALMQSGVDDADVADLESALKEEPHPAAGKFGPKVVGWIGRMMKKAADGSWKIGLGAAGELLASAISRYYGWPS